MVGMLGFVATSCTNTGERARYVKENESLRTSSRRLERTIEQRDATISRLTQQVTNLQQLGDQRPVTLFAPVKLEIASLSRGSDFDGQPGDDGVTVYLRPVDSDGDAVKAVGRVRIQLLETGVTGQPRVIGNYPFDDPKELREMWHGRLATQHFTIRCPFPPNVDLPANRLVEVRVEFLDFLSGATLTTSKQVPISFPQP